MVNGFYWWEQPQYTEKLEKVERALGIHVSQRAGIAFKGFNGRNHVQEKREQWRVRQAVELAIALTLGRARPNQGASHGTQHKVGGLKPQTSTWMGHSTVGPLNVHTANRRDPGKDCHILNKILEGKQVAHQVCELRMTANKNDRAQDLLSILHSSISPYGTAGDHDHGKSAFEFSDWCQGHSLC